MLTDCYQACYHRELYSSSSINFYLMRIQWWTICQREVLIVVVVNREALNTDWLALTVSLPATVVCLNSPASVQYVTELQCQHSIRCMCVDQSLTAISQHNRVCEKRGLLGYIHKSYAFMYELKTWVHFLITYIHSTETSLSRPWTCDTSVSAARARNGYIDQTWITSGTLNVQSDTRTTKPSKSQPPHPVPSLRSHFLTSPQPEGRTQALSVLTASWETYLCLLEIVTHPGHATHFSFKEIGSFTTWIFIVIHQVTFGPLAICKEYIFPVKRTE